MEVWQSSLAFLKTRVDRLGHCHDYIAAWEMIVIAIRFDVPLPRRQVIYCVFGTVLRTWITLRLKLAYDICPH